VLNDAERASSARVQAGSPLAARKRGAALVARNIAPTSSALADKPRGWRPLVYCWRGGQRSGSLALVLAQIGFRCACWLAATKAFRAVVLAGAADAAIAPPATACCAAAPAAARAGCCRRWRPQGAQVLDLEAGLPPRLGAGAAAGQPQPSQKAFDTLVWQALRGFDAARPVFAESESRTIGRLRVPETLLMQMRAAGRLRARADGRRPACLPARGLRPLRAEAPSASARCSRCALRGRETVARWQALARAGDWAALWSPRCWPSTTTRCTSVDAAQLRAASPGAAAGPGRWRRCTLRRPPRGHCGREVRTRLTGVKPTSGRTGTPCRRPPPDTHPALVESHRVLRAGRCRAATGLAGARLAATCCAARCPGCCTGWRWRPSACAVRGSTRRFWLLAGAFSGFLLVAPIVATGLYAVSRALERGSRPGCATALRAWRPDDGRLVVFGLLLALAGTGWVMTSAALITASRRRR
jgi:tRNA 2-selenouridine synthase